MFNQHSFDTTSIVFSFLDFRAQANIATVSKTTQQLVNDNPVHQTLQKMCHTGINEIEQFRQDTLIKMTKMDQNSLQMQYYTIAMYLYSFLESPKIHLTHVIECIELMKKPQFKSFVRSLHISFPEAFVFDVFFYGTTACTMLKEKYELQLELDLPTHFYELVSSKYRVTLHKLRFKPVQKCVLDNNVSLDDYCYTFDLISQEYWRSQ